MLRAYGMAAAIHLFILGTSFGAERGREPLRLF